MPQVQANGLTLEYDEHGDAGAPPIVLIMGFSGQMTMWPVSFVKSLAAKGFRVIRFDNRDIGLSTHLSHLGAPDIGAAMMAAASGQPNPNAAYLLDDMAADTVGLLDALGIDKAHIVGASMGGMIAQIVAAKHGARARSLVSIMSSTNRPGLPQAAPEIMGALITPPPTETREDRINAFKLVFRTIGSPGYPATEAELQALAENQADRAPYDREGIGRQLVAILSSEPRHEILGNVTCPALVLHGEADPLVRIEGGKDTADSISGAEFVSIPGMGHDFTEALMPVFLEHVGGFLERAEGRGKAA